MTFLEWALKQGYVDLNKRGSKYRDEELQKDWEVWQAATEAAAKLCNSIGNMHTRATHHQDAAVADECAAAIRKSA